MLMDMLLTQVPSDPCTAKLSSDSGSELSDFSSGEIEEELETLKPAQVCFVVHVKSAWTSVVLACLLALLTCNCIRCGQLEDCFFMLWTVVCHLVACQNCHRVSCVGMGGFVDVAGFKKKNCLFVCFVERCICSKLGQSCVVVCVVVE